MIARSLKSRVARAAFLRSYNDIDVFVEDQSKETRKMFSILLSNASGGEFDVHYVNPLGSKNDVIAACQADNKKNGRRRVYVIDGDMELTSASICMCVPRLFMLPRYCIENFLIGDDAAGAALASHSLVLTPSVAARKLNFSEWLSKNAPHLKELYLAYAAMRMADPSIPTVGFPLRKLISDDSGIVDPGKILVRIDELAVLVDAVEGVGTFDSWMVQLRAIRNEPAEEFVLKYVSGKDVLLPLLRLRMHKIEKMSSDAFLKIELAEHVESVELAEIFSCAQL